MIDWTEIIIAVCSLLITGFIIPLLRGKWQESKAKLSKADRETIESVVETAVRWAKQWLQSEAGETKKAEVMMYVSDKLKELGIEVSATDLDKIVEAVYERVKNEAKTIK